MKKELRKIKSEKLLERLILILKKEKNQVDFFNSDYYFLKEI